jgi:lysophospholipase L1-like esterase
MAASAHSSGAARGASRSRRALVNLALAAGSIAAALLALELLVRALVGDRRPLGKQLLSQQRRHHHAASNRGADCYPTPPHGQPQRVEPGRWRGALLLDTVRYQPVPFERLRDTPFCVEFSTNRAGFRGPELPAAPRQGGLRIVALGDSFTYGEGVADGDTMSAQLERLLGERAGAGAAAIEVVNLGEPGVNTEVELGTLRKHRHLAPDLVLLSYVLNDGFAGAAARAQRDPANDLINLRPARLRQPTGFEALLRRSSRLYLLLASRLEMRQVTERTRDWYRELFDPQRNADGLARTRQVLAALRDEARAQGAGLLVAIYPILHELDDYPFAAAHQVLGGLLDELGIPWIDLLRTAFAGRTAESLQVHPVDQHPNREAYSLAAAAIADVLSSRRLLVSRAGPPGAARPVPAATGAVETDAVQVKR